MGTTYQTILVAGDLADIRAGTSTDCVVLPVGERRWALIPRQHDGYAETEELARHLSRPPGTLTAAFQVYNSDILVAQLFRGGAGIHEYLSEQAYVEPYWEEDGTEVQMDFLGRPYGPDQRPPTGPYGADPAMFAPLADGEADGPALFEALTGREPMADHRHHELLHALNLRPRPLQSTYARAASDPEAQPARRPGHRRPAAGDHHHDPGPADRRREAGAVLLLRLPRLRPGLRRPGRWSPLRPGDPSRHDTAPRRAARARRRNRDDPPR